MLWHQKWAPILKMRVISSQETFWMSVFDCVMVLLSDYVLFDYW
jgi:hypothetical protein